MASDGFEVTAGDLKAASSAYAAQAASLKTAMTAFEKAADIPASAFGNLPQSGQLAAEYQKFAAKVKKDMGTLHRGLTNGATKLQLSAAQYKAAERANTISSL